MGQFLDHTSGQKVVDNSITVFVKVVDKISALSLERRVKQASYNLTNSRLQMAARSAAKTHPADITEEHRGSPLQYHSALIHRRST